MVRHYIVPRSQQEVSAVTMAPLYPENDPNARQIPLSRARVAWVDPVDYEWLSQFRWTFCEGRRGREGYAAHYLCEQSKITMTYMHRMILGAPPGTQVDHLNHRTLDHRRSNLRLATNQQNQHNRQAGSNCKSGYKGVSKHTQHGNWCARITVPGGAYKHLGCFDTPEDAARAYNAAALALFGLYAYLNDLPEQPNQP